jgi:DUF1365 family protein
LFAYNRAGLFSLYDRDHLDGTATPLRQQVEACLQSAGIETGKGPIRLLTLPRIMGYAFNPISVYFCHHRSGALAAILYEVNNTFGQRHSYLLPVDRSQGEAGPITQHCDKLLYVSPFMDMDLRYTFRVRRPGEHIKVAVDAGDAGGLIIATALRGARRPFSDRALLRGLVAYPFLSFKVMAAIHWEAMKLWIKGMRLRKRPPAPACPITIGSDWRSVPARPPAS